MGLFGKKGPPSAEQAAKRARALAYLVMRQAVCPPPDMIERLKSQWSEQERKEFDASFRQKSDEVLQQVKSEGLWDEVSGDERRMWSVPAHQASAQDAVNVMWRCEAIRAVLWALKVMEAPGPYDQEAEHASVVKACLDAVVPGSAVLRSADELEEERSIAETWHWRSRTRQLQQGPEPIRLPPGITMEEVVRMSAEMMVERGAFPASVGNDFAAMGKPYRDLTDEEWSLVRSITMERHYALNWLCGFAPKNDWDRTPTDT